MQNITYFHRPIKNGFSINKVTQTLIRDIPQKEEYYVPSVGASLSAIISNIRFVHRHRDKTGINHITGDIHYCMIGLIGCKSVLTIHDTVAVDFLPIGWIKKRLLEWLWFRIPLRIATKIICISESTKKSIARFTSRKDIIVIHNAIDPTFLVDNFRPMNPVPHILLLGTNRNKNVNRTLCALTDIPCHVTIIGKLNHEMKTLLNRLKINCTCKSDLTDAEIIEEYKACDIVSFITLFEGFGMPVIEANSIGRPVICSNIEVLHEIAGCAALYVNPYDQDDMRAGFMRLIHDYDLQQQLINNGFENVKRFGAKSLRARLVKVYEGL